MQKRKLKIRDAARYARTDSQLLLDEIVRTQGFKKKMIIHHL